MVVGATYTTMHHFGGRIFHFLYAVYAVVSGIRLDAVNCMHAQKLSFWHNFLPFCFFHFSYFPLRFEHGNIPFFPICALLFHFLPNHFLVLYSVSFLIVSNQKRKTTFFCFSCSLNWIDNAQEIERKKKNEIKEKKIFHKINEEKKNTTTITAIHIHKSKLE